MSKNQPGTTIEILAPYLAHGIQVQASECVAEKLIGLCYNATELVNVEYHDNPGKNYWHGTKHCLPVLRDFKALSLPLEQGEIPALVAVSYLVNDWAARYNFKVFEVRGNRVTVQVLEWDEEVGEQPIAYVSILADWSFFLEPASTITHLENISATYDYLRSKHFSVGLREDQYIRKVA